MGTNIVADVTINNNTAAGLTAAAASVRAGGRRITQELGKIGDDGTKQMMRSIQAASPRIAAELHRALAAAERNLQLHINGPDTALLRARLAAVQQQVNQTNTNIGASYSNTLLKSLQKVAPNLAAQLATVGESIGPALVAAAVAAAPLVGAAVSGALLGGAGIAGLGAGVALAFKDARIQEAGKNMFSNILASLRQDSGTFVEPLLASIDKVKARFVTLEPVIQSIFAKSAVFLGPLTDGLLDLVGSIATGINGALAGAGPVVSAIGAGLTQVGDALSDFFTSLNDNGQESAVALAFVFGSVAATIKTVGFVINGLAEIFGAVLGKFADIVRLFPGGSKVVDDFKEKLNGVGTSGESANAGFRLAAGGAEEAAKQSKDYAQVLEDQKRAEDEAISSAVGLFNAQTSLASSYQDAKKAARENGKTLDENTEKGRANRSALAALATGYASYKADLEKVNGVTVESSAKLAVQRSRFVAVAGSMGLSAGRANALADELLGIPTERQTKVTAPGLLTAKREAQNLKNEILGLPSNKTVTVSVNVNASRLDSIERRLARVGGGAGMAGESSFGLNAGGSGARVGGPMQVQSNVSVNLDGRPFRTYTVRAVEAERKRAEFRSKVGRRDS